VAEAVPGVDTLVPAERRTLAAVCDALVPSIRREPDPHGFYARSATDLGIDGDIARIVETYLPPDRRADFRRFLHTLESPLWNLLLTGRPSRFTALSEAARERYLLGWAHSRLGAKRQGFHSTKRLVHFLFYSKVPGTGGNPNWPAIGYDGPAPRAADAAPVASRVDAVRPERETTIGCDVCVVGSGAGGAVIAARLAEAGHRVAVLEAGPYVTAGDFRGLEADAYDTMYEGRGILTTEDLAIGVLAGRVAGGSTTINWMTCLRPPPWALEEWERDHGLLGVTSGGFSDLVDDVERRLHVTTSESRVNPSNDVLRRGCEALGYRAGIDFEVIPRNALGCEGRCTYCAFGCATSSKQSTAITYLPDAARAGARCLFDTRADAILVRAGEAVGVDATYRGGTREVPVHVRARAVVAAGGAIQTPALLWRSGIRFRWVGRGLRLDPTTALLAEYRRPIRMWEGPMQTIVVRRFQDSDEGHHGPWIEAVPGHPGLAALGTPWHGGRAHKDALARLDRAARTIVLVRDVAEGRVTVDGRGEPRLEYRLSGRDRANLVRGLQEAARIHRAAGAIRIATLHLRDCSVGDGTSPVPEGPFDAFLDRIAHLGITENGLALFTAHPMGSCRAGRDPRASAADGSGECHEARNLWIGDGSLLPTAPGVNPMISIMALAARTAGVVHERLRAAP
jgi:choline dehydrogenase-like flavoprotein